MCSLQSVEYRWDSKEYKAFNSQKQSAKKRGIEFDLTFDQWISWWMSTGHFEDRGKTVGKYQMCRFNDSGAYDLNNIYCDTVSANSALPTKGKPRPAEFNRKTGDALRGKPKTITHRRNHAFSQLGKLYSTPFGVFYTAGECEQASGVKAGTIMWRCKNNYLGQWSYKEAA